jgi:hypothetical protein
MMMGSMGERPPGMQGLGLAQLVGDVINSKDRFLQRQQMTEGARPYMGGGSAQITEVPSMPEIGSRNWVAASGGKPNTYQSGDLKGQEIGRADPSGTMRANPNSPTDMAAEAKLRAHLEGPTIQDVEARGRAADMEYSRMSPAEKEALAQKDAAAGTDFRIEPAQKQAAEGETIGKLAEGRRNFDTKWEDWAAKIGADPETTSRAARLLGAQAYEKGIDPLPESQLKYYLTLMHQQGHLTPEGDY